jgi:membrane protease YdiL (CAAX protease family)
MDSQHQNNKGMVRNLAIFAVVVLASGWLGYGLDRLMNSPPTQSLGMLLWLIAPLVTSLLLRAFAGDGWKDFGLRPAFKGNIIWYGVSLLIYPLVAVLVLTIGGLLGLVTFPNFSLSLLLSVFAMGLIPSFIKNIFEEFAWRGYLTPKIQSLALNAYVGHVIVGLIWGGWHIPYWLFVLGRPQIQASAGQDLAAFIPMAILNISVASIAYGEIRLLTHSVWPPVIMHTVGNALIDVLIARGLIHIAMGMEFLVSPLQSSLLTLVFFLLAGIWLHQRRVSKQSVG